MDSFFKEDYVHGVVVGVCVVFLLGSPQEVVKFVLVFDLFVINICPFQVENVAEEDEVLVEEILRLPTQSEVPEQQLYSIVCKPIEVFFAVESVSKHSLSFMHSQLR